MAGNITEWVVEKLNEDSSLTFIEQLTENCIKVKYEDGLIFCVAVIGVEGVVKLSDVQPLFFGSHKPDLVINVPSKTLWEGDAIDHVHQAPAAFGKLGDIQRAARLGQVSSFRNKNVGFFINAMNQHTNVTDVKYIYDSVFEIERVHGRTLKVAIVEAYLLSAEDVRHAKNVFDEFDIIVKSSSYGAISPQAKEAARDIGAEALMFRELMGRLAR